MKPLWILLLLALSGGCAALVGADTTTLSIRKVPLDRERPNAQSVGGLNFLGALELEGDDAIGGLSGLWVAADGSRFVAVGDTGLVATDRLDHGPDGRLSGASDPRARPLPVENGAPQKKSWTDAEELLRLPDGGWLVAFERRHRILRYPAGEDGPDGTPTPVPLPPTVAEKSPPNGGLEALTRLADGRLLTIEEGDERTAQEHRAWVTRAPGLPEREEDWLPLTYRAAPNFRPVGAAALPDGGALVLERRVSLLGGWSSRVVRLPASSLRAGTVAAGQELARLESPLLNDNFEAIATRTGPAGETLVYLVSDNNFSRLQRTYLALFAVAQAP